MKDIAVEGVSAGHVFVELHTYPWRGWWNDPTILPMDGSLQDLGVESAPILDAFENEEVGRTRCKLDIGCTDNRPAIEMWSDLGVVRLRQGGNLLALEDATSTTQVGLQDVGCSKL